MAKKIIVSCDFLMTRPVTQRYHLRWFSTIVTRAIKNAFDIEVFSYESDTQQTLKRADFFKKSGMRLDAAATHFHFDAKDITDASLAMISKEFRDSIVIGYEISEATRAVLDRAEVKYIDIWLHPVRFMDDNFFAMSSNYPEILEKIHQHHLTDDIYYLYADKLRIQSYMGWNKYEGHLNNYLIPNSALFVGQTLTDKAVCREGTMLNILNFKENFLDLSRKYDHIYFSRHPMLKEGDDDQISFISTIENVSLIDEPGYRLLTADAIKEVCAISSGLVYEAKFFGKKGSYLFNPVIEIFSKNNTGGYRSIYGKLHSPKFWGDVLEIYFQRKTEIPQYDFIKTNSNYRDMLSLYYNSHVFDKEHSTFKTLTEGKIHKNSEAPMAHVEQKNGFELNSINCDRIKKMIDEHRVVSFDIFDTLLQRDLLLAGDIVKLVAAEASERFGIDAQAFITARRDAKRHSSKNEVPLEERYSLLGQILGIDPSVSEALFTKEIALERALLSERKIGKILFEYAVTKKKRVVVTSDTYFDGAFIREILSREGFNPDAYYLSRDHDATKAEGSLFSILSSSEGKDLLHIGDNQKSDYINATTAGLNAAWLISNHEQVKRSMPNIKLSSSKDSIVATIQNGILVNNLSRYPALTKDPGYTQGTHKDFGFNVFGDMIMAFAAWIIIQAKADGHKMIFFLARDGEIVKKATDLLLKNAGDSSLKTAYVLASRRCVRVIALQHPEHVRREADLLLLEITKNRNLADLTQYISLRFGLSEKQLKNMSVPTKKDYDRDATSLQKFLSTSSFERAVLENAATERKLYLKYLDQIEFPDHGSFAVVDIGHNGSLQASLASIRNLPESNGYYFATYNKVDQTLAHTPGEHKATGYYRNRTSSEDRSDKYVRYALMIESLFLNDKGTFLRFTEESGNLLPNYLQGDSERRFEFNRALHQGTLDYIDRVTITLVDCCGALKYDDLASQHDACARYFDMLEGASIRDAKSLSSITFENFFSGRKLRYLVPPAALCDDDEGIWREGTRAMRASKLASNHTTSTKRQDNKNLTHKKTMRSKVVLRAFRPILSPHLSKNELTKYDAEPRALFQKSKHPVMRLVGAAAGLRKYRLD